MADFRTIKTAMWREDDWFLDLETDAKLFWIYLFSNPSASVAGIYRLSERTMSHETGLSIERVGQLLAEFAQAGKAYFSNGVLWVVRMREHQETSSIKVQTRIKNDIAGLPKENQVYRMYCARYGIDTVSIPIPTVTVTVTDTVCVTGDASQDEPQPKDNTHTPPPFGFMDRTDDQKAILRQFQDITAQVITGSEKRVAWLDDMTASAGKVRMTALLSDMQAEIQAGRLIPYNALKWLSDSLRTTPGKNGKHPPSIDDMPDFGSTPT